MTALTKGRNTPQRDVAFIEKDVAAAKVIYEGALVCLNSSGDLTPGAVATGLIAVGRAEETVDNSDGSAGDLTCRVRTGVFRWANSADSDEITDAEIGDLCYVVDDQTVAKTSNSSTRSPAGVVVDVDAQGVWVRSGVEGLATPAGALLAASNLSDLGSLATARSNLGVAEKMGTPTIVVGTQAGDAINVTVQLKDSDGDLGVRGSLFAYLSDDANGDSIAGTAPDGGWAIGTDGLLIPDVTGKSARLVSEADGDIDITITEAGADTWYLILVMPDGRLVASDAITFS